MKTRLEMSPDDLKSILDAQRDAIADYITRNLTTYTHFQKSMEGLDIVKMKDEMKDQVRKAPYPDDYNILKKYLPQ